ncbi:UDP-N-acetylmuramoyl-L-alanine--D-glutamate ligase [Mechercharimyces sp. CAU 1602]|uniref:UDP-N-acetylmuramoyl-L-alanine--D-glutamate ligase n=1 Tax=Mechercharimyces sp. CAU 1602 TaxID=2973933 RepID=UPI002161DAC6|nr:UDP-N-acetylmuramoyl-L-alanine--D-glutamate ligase [Mechercharimyces sp. CAU 1602]MCS1350623.1 UDP-N-acetylmuramoyl-L-alanine--D-glutamate ligase [Mechercharimyces sp. CAU 1602]
MSKQPSPFLGQTVVVLGLGRSGVAVARLLHAHGANVTVNDAKERSQAPEADVLEALGIQVICGGHPDDLINEEVDFVVKNPGIPYRIAPIVSAMGRGIPVVTEVEVASRVAKASIIGITGSNGKTTTTTLVGAIMAKAGQKYQVAGNIGRALTDVVTDMETDEWLVAELSSFQLKGTSTFRPRIGALLNVTEAHLDYHGAMEDYVSSKLSLFQAQQQEDLAILNYDDEICRKVSGSLSSRIWWFSRTQSVPCGVWVERGEILAKMETGLVQSVLPVAEVLIPGQHHLENALAATAIALAAGSPLLAIQETLRTFSGVEHRLEFVREYKGVRYYNDSKATNAQAARLALESFSAPVVWIAGGLDRGVDFHELLPVLAKQVRGVVVYGEAASTLAARAEEAGVPFKEVEDVLAATRVASAWAQAKDVVLLSPACASWDKYPSFEVRGSIFKQAVHRLN